MLVRGKTYAWNVYRYNASNALESASTVSISVLRNGVLDGAVVADASSTSAGVYAVSVTIPDGWVVSDLAQVVLTLDGVPHSVLVAPVIEWASAADAAAAKTAAESADGKLSAGRLSRVDRLPDVNPGTTGGLALHGATGGGSGDAEQATSLEILESVESIAVALAGGSPVEPTGTNIRDQLQEIYDGLFPADPDVPPVVITPGTGDITTGWMVCLDEAGEAEKDVAVYCQMSDVPASESGFAHSAKIQTATSAANGVVEFSLVKGASYFFWRGKASPNGSLDPVAIPSDAGSTYELPSIRAIV